MTRPVFKRVIFRGGDTLALILAGLAKLHALNIEIGYDLRNTQRIESLRSLKEKGE